MRTSRKKMITVTSSEGVRRRVDEFLSGEYQAWREMAQPRRNGLGIFSCGSGASNALIMDYVRWIYSQYGIADPLADGRQGGSVAGQRQDSRGTPKRGISQDPRQQYLPSITINLQEQTPQAKPPQKENLRESQIMEQTPVRRMSDQFSETIPKKAMFDSMQSTQHQRDGSNQYERGTLGSIDHRHVVRKLDDFYQEQQLYGGVGVGRLEPRNSEPIREIQSVQLGIGSDNNGSHPVTPIYTPKQAKNNLQANMLNKFSRKMNELSRQQEQIPQVYRYCLACQQAVLDANIETHQIKCSQFAKVYELDLGGLLDHLHQKIQILKQKVRARSDSLKQADFQHMKTTCQNMDSECEQIFKTGHITHRYVQNYDEAIKIGRRWSLTAEEINKLRWFVKVREEIKKKFNM